MLLGGQNDWQRILFWAAAHQPPVLSAGTGDLSLGTPALQSHCRAARLFLYCFSPDILAHARLATMDLGLCFFFVTTLIFLPEPARELDTHAPTGIISATGVTDRPCSSPSAAFSRSHSGCQSNRLAACSGSLLALLLQPAEDRLTFKPLPGFPEKP